MRILVGWDTPAETALLQLYLAGGGGNEVALATQTDPFLAEANEHDWDVVLLTLTFPTLEKGFAVFEKVHAPVAWLPWLAGAELAGAAGLLLGLAAPLPGVAAGVGVTVYFTAAVWAHLRVGDRAVASPALPGVLAVAAVGLRIASA